MSRKPTKDSPYYWIQKYALAQAHFDEVGIGWERTLDIKRQIIGWDKSLEDCTISQLRKLINALRKEYKREVDNDENKSGDRPR